MRHRREHDLFKLTDAMKARKVQFDLAAHHVEHKKQFRASHDLHHSSSFSAPAGKLKDLFVTDEILWDSMGLFLIGPNSGTISQGAARHAFNGACWPRVGWNKEYNPGYVAKSYKGTLPPHLVEAAASKELLQSCREVSRLLKPQEKKFKTSKKAAEPLQVSMPHPL